jgi:hypothetical protein
VKAELISLSFSPACATAERILKSSLFHRFGRNMRRCPVLISTVTLIPSVTRMPFSVKESVVAPGSGDNGATSTLGITFYSE